MSKSSRSSRSTDRIEIEPGADKRLATILKRALNTPPQHRGDAKGQKTSKTK